MSFAGFEIFAHGKHNLLDDDGLVTQALCGIEKLWLAYSLYEPEYLVYVSLAWAGLRGAFNARFSDFKALAVIRNMSWWYPFCCSEVGVFLCGRYAWSNSVVWVLLKVQDLRRSRSDGKLF